MAAEPYTEPTVCTVNLDICSMAMTLWTFTSRKIPIQDIDDYELI